MPEQTMVSGPDRIQYEGVFSVAELFRLIDEWLLDKGYYRVEPKHVESAKPEGKFVELDLTPGKELTDYAKALLRIKIQMSNINFLAQHLRQVHFQVIDWRLRRHDQE
jgi:hypothetical protein